MSTDMAVRVNAAMEEILAEIPGRLNIRAILVDAHRRLVEVAAGGPTQHPALALAPEVSQIVGHKIAEVLQEIATIAVDEFTNRTGQKFNWVDEPDESENDEPLMSFGLDDRGNVVFGNTFDDAPKLPEEDGEEVTQHRRSEREKWLAQHARKRGIKIKPSGRNRRGGGV